MRRNAAFTLVELLAVIAILAVLGALCMTAGRRALFLRTVAYCKDNVSAIGKGIGIYTSAGSDTWPWLVSDGQWDAPTGAGQMTPPSPSTGYNVSALFFVLICDGQSPSIFICPGTTDTPDPNVKTGTSYHWDFSPYKDGNSEHLSYSYQAPTVDDTGIIINGATFNCEAGLVVAADRTPTYDGLNPTFNWASPGSADPKTGMSTNHQGERINLLYADLHVGESIGRADVGIMNDNIFSAAGLGADGNALDTNQGAGSLKLTDHRSYRDSFLLGPTKMEK